MTQTLATGPMAQAIGWALLHLLWQGALVAAALAGVRAVLPERSANLRYAASCAALVLIVVLGVGTAFRSYVPGPAAQSVVATATHSLRPAVHVAATVALSSVVTAAPNREAVRAFVSAANRMLPAIVMVWLLGVFVCSLRLIVDGLRVRRLVTRGASAARAPWPHVTRRLADALGVRHAIRVLESAAVEVPSVVGLMRPAILLPASTLTGLTPAQIEMIIAHELAHVRRHDFLVNLLQATVETLLFYHPAVWWISACVRAEREHCCDDLAVSVCGNPLQYARALSRLEELRGSPVPLAASAAGGSLLERVRRLVLGSRPAAGNPAKAAAAVAVFSCVALAVVAPSLPGVGHWAIVVPGRSQAWAQSLAERAQATPATAAIRVEHGRARMVADAVPAPAPAPAPASVCTADADAPAAPEESDVVVDPDRDAQDAPQAEPDTDTPRIPLDDLIELGAQNVTPQDVREMRALFPRAPLREIARMRAVGATPALVRALRAAGLEVRTPDDAQGLAALGVTAASVRALREAGVALESARDAQGLAAVGVTPAYVRAMRSAGLALESTADLQGLAAVGVTPEYVEAMRSAGLAIETARDAEGLAAVGVTPRLVRALREAGVAVENARAAQGLAAVGVSPEYVRNMRSAGMAIRTAEDVQGLAAVGVTPRFVRDMRAAGMAVENAHEAQGLAAVGVTPEYVRAMREAGVQLTEARDAQSLRALGITPEFVQKLSRAGYHDLSVEALARLGASGLTGDFVREMSKYRSQ